MQTCTKFFSVEKNVVNMFAATRPRIQTLHHLSVLKRDGLVSSLKLPSTLCRAFFNWTRSSSRLFEQGSMDHGHRAYSSNPQMSDQNVHEMKDEKIYASGDKQLPNVSFADADKRSSHTVIKREGPSKFYWKERLGSVWQRSYDDFWTCDGYQEYPTELHHLRDVIAEIRLDRERFGIDQSCLAPGQSAVLQARKVIYAVFPFQSRTSCIGGHENFRATSGVGAISNVLLQSTRDTAADNLTFQLARAQFDKTSKHAFWLRCHGQHEMSMGMRHQAHHIGRNASAKTSLLVIPLESLLSENHFFGRMHEERLSFWRDKLEDLEHT